MDIVKIAVIGLGYVGLPLARLFSTKYKTVGFDMNKSRVDALMQDTMLPLKFRTNCYSLPLPMASSARLTLKTFVIATFILWQFLPLWIITIIRT